MQLKLILMMNKFSEGRCVASATAVMVLIDEVTRKPAPLTAQFVAGLQRWVRRGVTIAPPA